MTEQHIPEGSPQHEETPANTNLARRQFFKRLGVAGATGVAATAGGATVVAAATKAASEPSWGGSSFMDTMGDLFQKQYTRMSDEEMTAALERIKRKAKRKFGVDINCEDTKPVPGTYFGYALNLSKCRGYRDCVEACVSENNLGRDSQVQYPPVSG